MRLPAAQMFGLRAGLRRARVGRLAPVRARLPVVRREQAGPRAQAVDRRAGLAVWPPAASRAVVAVSAASSSAAARVPFHVPVPAAAQPEPGLVPAPALVPPSVRSAQGLPRAEAYGARRLAVVSRAQRDVAVQPDAVAAERAVLPAVAAPDVAAGAAASEPDAVAAEAARPAELPLEPLSVRPLALPQDAWAFRPDLAPPWLALPRSARTAARARELTPVASPSGRSWQAARGVVLSCALGPGKIWKSAVVKRVIKRI